jgi:hypothetical protein
VHLPLNRLQHPDPSKKNTGQPNELLIKIIPLNEGIDILEQTNVQGLHMHLCQILNPSDKYWLVLTLNLWIIGRATRFISFWMGALPQD